MRKLKPCPWCGETEKRRIIRPGLNDRYFIDHFDAVFHLQSSIGFESEDEAAAAWNKMRPYAPRATGADIGVAADCAAMPAT